MNEISEETFKYYTRQAASSVGTTNMGVAYAVIAVAHAIVIAARILASAYKTNLN